VNDTERRERRGRGREVTRERGTGRQGERARETGAERARETQRPTVEASLRIERGGPSRSIRRTCGYSTCGYSTCGYSTCGYSTCGYSTCGYRTCGYSTCGYSTCTYGGQPRYGSQERATRRFTAGSHAMACSRKPWHEHPHTASARPSAAQRCKAAV
jgi:hypothetical protein